MEMMGLMGFFIIISFLGLVWLILTLVEVNTTGVATNASDIPDMGSSYSRCDADAVEYLELQLSHIDEIYQEPMLSMKRKDIERKLEVERVRCLDG